MSTIPVTVDAADLPPELLRNILFFITVDDKGNPVYASWDMKPVSKENKRALSNCILTCVDWAKQTRCLLFEQIVLKSAEDTRALSSFATNPPSSRFQPISYFVHSVQVVHVPKAQPWLHHLYPTLKSMGQIYNPFDRRYEVNRMHFSRPADSTWAWTWRPLGWLSLKVTFTSPENADDPIPFRSIHQGLPRRLPLCYHAFETLTIDHIHFRSLNDMLHVLQELNALRFLELYSVTWDEGSDVTLVDPVRFRLQQSWIRVEAKGCTDDTLAVLSGLCATTRSSRNRGCLATSADIQTMAAIMQWIPESPAPLQDMGMSGSSEKAAGGYCDTDISLCITGINPDRRDSYDPYRLTPRITFGTSDAKEPAAEALSPLAPRHIQHIIIEFEEHDFSNYLNHDWMAFAEYALQFPALRMVVFGFAADDDMKAFCETNGRAVKRLQETVDVRMLWHDASRYAHGARRYMRVNLETMEPQGKAVISLHTVPTSL